jgi:hypothetical protein
MKLLATISSAAGVLASLGLILSSTGCGPSAPPPVSKPKAASLSKTNLLQGAPTNLFVWETNSVFDETLKKGRDPFFPESHRREPATVAQVVAAKKAVPVVRLKGISGTASRRFALINNRTFEAGEQGSVRVAEGQIQLRCLEIGASSVKVLVEGEHAPKELHLNEGP